MDTVLVIDDEAGPRESLRYLLKDQYQIHCADNVAAGLDVIRRTPPDLIILDLRMPEMNGIDGLREIRKLDPDVAVIILTGFATIETAQEAIRLGATDYLKKPFETDALIAAVKANLARSQINRRRARAEREMAAINQRLQDALGEQEHLAKMGMASAALVHDLRNPLTAANGYVALLSEEFQKLRRQPAAANPEEAAQYLDVIERNLARCRELTEVWHQIGRCDMSRALPVAVRELVWELVSAMQGDLVAQDRELRIAEGPLSAGVIADSAQMLRALSNVLRNALQAVSPKTGWVEVGWHVQGGECAITIRDNGRGIPADHLQRIVEPFFTTRHVEGGTGLGLFIAQEVVRAHGGRLTIESEVGVGTAVSVLLPRADLAEESPQGLQTDAGNG